MTALDTITTRFFMLFVFMTTVPLVAMALFSASIIQSDMEQDIDQQFKLGEHMFNVHLENRYQRLSAHALQMAQKSSGASPDALLKLCPAEGWVECRVLDLSTNNLYGATADSADAQSVLKQVRPVHQPRFWITDNTIHLLTAVPLSHQPRLLILSEPVQEGLLNPLLQQQEVLKTQIQIIPVAQQVAGNVLASANGSDEPLLSTSRFMAKLLSDETSIKTPNEQYRVHRKSLLGPNGQSVAMLTFVIPMTSQQSLVNYYYTGTYIMGILGLVFAILVALLAGRPITKPLLQLIQQVNNLSRENIMDGKVNIRGVYEINQLNDSFNRMFERLRDEQKMKDEFVATLTHDLKVPMIAEKQTLAYMSKKTYGPLTDTQEDVLEGLITSNDSCLSLVNGILQVYRYESGQMTLMTEHVAIDVLIDEVLAELKPLADEKNIEIMAQHNLSEGRSGVHADRLEVKRVLHNLISNAITNTTRGGKITCRTADASGWGQDAIYKVSQFQYTTLKSPLSLEGRILVSIEDTGIGFSPEDIPNLFKQFAVGKGRNPMSIGLGLYNCYQVVQAHNGSLWVETSEGEGSAVCFLLPVDARVASDRRKRVDRRKK